MDEHSHLRQTAKRASLSRIGCPLREIRECTLAADGEWPATLDAGVALLRVTAGSVRWRPGGCTVSAGSVAIVRLTRGSAAVAGRGGARVLPIAYHLLHAGAVDPLEDLVLPIVVRGDGLDGRADALLQAVQAAPRRPWRRVEARGLALALLGAVLDRAETDGVLHARAQHPDWLVRTIACADRRIGDRRLAVGDLAAAAGMPLSSFSRSFRHLLGDPPRRWLEQRRMVRAHALLESGAAVKTVATRCGFASSAQFIRRFGLLHRQTPGAWRAARVSPETAGNEDPSAGRRNRRIP